MVRQIFSLFSFLVFLFSTPALFAAGNIFVSKTIAIEAPAAEVWDKVKDFNGLNTWHPAVASVDITEGENNVPGAVRKLTLQDGGTINETLQTWDATSMTYSYNITESVLPVSDYEATLEIVPITPNSTKVTWSASFNAGKGADDETARDTISGIFDSGLENLSVMMSGQ